MCDAPKRVSPALPLLTNTEKTVFIVRLFLHTHSWQIWSAWGGQSFKSPMQTPESNQNTRNYDKNNQCEFSREWNNQEPPIWSLSAAWRVMIQWVLCELCGWVGCNPWTPRSFALTVSAVFWHVWLDEPLLEATTSTPNVRELTAWPLLALALCAPL